MFFKTPGEMKPILSQLFSLCLSQEVDVQVRDRSLFYYRLLSSDLQKAAEIINADKLPISSFSDTFSLFIPVLLSPPFPISYLSIYYYFIFILLIYILPFHLFYYLIIVYKYKGKEKNKLTRRGGWIGASVRGV